MAGNSKERNYIRYRKLKAACNSLCFYLCRVFPLDKKLVSVCTFEGKGGFGCNPKYLVQELHRRDPELRFVWFVNDMTKEFPGYIRKVPNTLWSRAWWLSRSKVWIDNYRKPYGTRKRRGQYYLNVNHYTLAIKCVGLWRGKGFSEMAYLVSRNDSLMIDGVVIDSAFCEQMLPKGLVYDGAFLKTGAPRCDILHGDRSLAKRAIRQKHGLPADAKILMFAPTFREGAKNGVRSVFCETWTLDFTRLLDSLESKFGGEWYICTRVHPQLAPTFAGYADSAVAARMFDESHADDMYEILAGMDAYITDYSSACFEAALARMPVFLYADDVDTYTHDRGNLFWNMVSDDRHAIGINKDLLPKVDATLPFPLARTNDELAADIKDFDADDYGKKLDAFMTALGVVFDGKSSGRLAELVVQEKGL